MLSAHVSSRAIFYRKSIQNIVSRIQQILVVVEAVQTQYRCVCSATACISSCCDEHAWQPERPRTLHLQHIVLFVSGLMSCDSSRAGRANTFGCCCCCLGFCSVCFCVVTGLPTRPGGTHVRDYLYLLKHIINEHAYKQVIKSGGYARRVALDRTISAYRRAKNEQLFLHIFKSYHKLASWQLLFPSVCGKGFNVEQELANYIIQTELLTANFGGKLPIFSGLCH